jgi:hypothetical protein
MSKQSSEDVTLLFQQNLNKHGYGFHFSVLKKIRNLLQQDNSTWFYEAAEFPVAHNGKGTRIDFILRRKTDPLFFLLAECKRADPAVSHWCFIRAEPYSAKRPFEMMFFEKVSYSKESTPSLTTEAPNNGLAIHNDPYHIGFAIKKGSERGDGNGETGGVKPIEESATQISRAQSGFVNFLGDNPHLLSNALHAYILPVIFTTASLWTTEKKLSDADVSTGHIDLSEAPMQSRSWLLYQYAVSPDIKHRYSTLSHSESLGDILDAEYLRTIAIVNVSGIEEYFNWANHVRLV